MHEDSVRKIPTCNYNIHELQEDPYLHDHVLFAHAVSDCDTICAIYRQEKATAYRIIKKKITR